MKYYIASWVGRSRRASKNGNDTLYLGVTILNPSDLTEQGDCLEVSFSLTEKAKPYTIEKLSMLFGNDLDLLRKATLEPDGRRFMLTEEDEPNSRFKRRELLPLPPILPRFSFRARR